MLSKKDLAQLSKKGISDIEFETTGISPEAAEEETAASSAASFFFVISEVSS